MTIVSFVENRLYGWSQSERSWFGLDSIDEGHGKYHIRKILKVERIPAVDEMWSVDYRDRIKDDSCVFSLSSNL